MTRLPPSMGAQHRRLTPPAARRDSRAMRIVPPARPRLSREELRTRLAPFDIDRERYPLIVVGIRGYYRNTMGQPRVNDRGLYDDALFIDSPQVTAAFNGNTDPSTYRPGRGRGRTKGIASLESTTPPASPLAPSTGKSETRRMPVSPPASA